HDDECADHRTEIVADASRGECEENVDRQQRDIEFRDNKTGVVRVERAREHGKSATNGKGFHLEFQDVLAGESSDLRVLADSSQDAAERRASHALNHEKREAKHDKTEDEVSKIEIGAERGFERLRDTGNAVSPAREPNLVLSGNAHHLGKTESNDREIV